MQHTDNLSWLGKQKHNRPLLIKFTLFMVKIRDLEQKSRLKGTKLKIENDYDLNSRLKRKALIRYMWRVENWANLQFLCMQMLK